MPLDDPLPRPDAPPRWRDYWRRGTDVVRRRRYYRVVGRFHAGKRVMSFGYRQRERLDGLFGRRAAPPDGETLFRGVASESCVRALRDEGLFTGLSLPPSLTGEILRHASVNPCHRLDGRPGERFLFGEIRNGRLASGEPVPVADVIPAPCAAIDLIARDALMFETVRRYFGYRPRRVLPRLFWSPVSDLSDAVRRGRGQTIDFHYDIDGYNAVYAYFYITGATHRSGAHVTVRRSHRSKPLSMVFSSCFQPESAILARYGRDSETVIEGGAGFGFIEDPACFHRVLPPVEADRLILQLRYA